MERPAGFRSNTAAPGDVPLKPRGRDPRFGRGARADGGEWSEGAGAKWRDESAGRQSEAQQLPGGDDEQQQQPDARDAEIRRLRQRVAELESQLAGGREVDSGGDGSDGDGDAVEHKSDGGAEGGGGAEADEGEEGEGAAGDGGGDGADGEELVDVEAYLAGLPAMSNAHLLTELAKHGEGMADISEAASLTREAALELSREQMQGMSVAQLRALLLVRGDDLSNLAEERRDELLLLLAGAIEESPGQAEGVTAGPQQATDVIVSSLDRLEVEWIDRGTLVDRLAALLLSGVADVAGAYSVLEELGVDTGPHVDREQLLALVKGLGPPPPVAVEGAETEEDVEPERKPKLGDPDYVMEKKQGKVGGGAVALAALRKDAKPDRETEFWRWRSHPEGRALLLQQRRRLLAEFCSLKADGKLDPCADPIKAGSGTMTRSQMNAKITLLKRRAVTEPFRRNPLVRPRSRPRAGWLYKWRPGAGEWRKRWCAVAKDTGSDGHASLRYWSSDVCKRELGRVRLWGGQLRHHGVLELPPPATPATGVRVQPVVEEEEEEEAAEGRVAGAPSRSDVSLELSDAAVADLVDGSSFELEQDEQLMGSSSGAAEDFEVVEGGPLDAIDGEGFVVEAESARQDGVDEKAPGGHGAGMAQQPKYLPVHEGWSQRSVNPREQLVANHFARVLSLESELGRLQAQLASTKMRAGSGAKLKLQKDCRRLEASIAHLRASASGADVCFVLLDGASGKASLFRTGLEAKAGRVDIDEWVRALAPHLGTAKELEAQRVIDEEAAAAGTGGESAAAPPQASTPNQARRRAEADKVAAQLRGEAPDEEDSDNNDDATVASSALVRSARAPGTGAVQSVWAVRARTRYAVVQERRFEPWKSGLRRLKVEAREKALIEESAKEWIPCGAPTANMEAKMESLQTGFRYPAETEAEDG
jgi:hypothetical protein